MHPLASPRGNGDAFVLLDVPVNGSDEVGPFLHYPDEDPVTVPGSSPPLRVAASARKIPATLHVLIPGA
ncbi:MAG TPA: hypothetical protein VGF31_01305 [Myxococcaceae bacterium]